MYPMEQTERQILSVQLEHLHFFLIAAQVQQVESNRLNVREHLIRQQVWDQDLGS